MPLFVRLGPEESEGIMWSNTCTLWIVFLQVMAS